MTLENLARIGKLKAHAADEREIARLLESADRALKDAAVAGLSTDSRLELAYRALMQAALAAMLANGYRPATSEPGHHQVVIQALPKTIGMAAERVQVLEAYAGGLSQGEKSKRLSRLAGIGRGRTRMCRRGDPVARRRACVDRCAARQSGSKIARRISGSGGLEPELAAERAELAHSLVVSLDGPAEEDAESAWDAEILRRLAEIESGTAELVDRDELRRRMRARMSRA